MKKTILTKMVMLVGLVLLGFTSYSQADCQVIANPLTVNNSNASIAATPICGTHKDYIPSNTNPEYTPIKTIRLVLHSFCDDNGNGNYNDIQIDNPSHNTQSQYWNSIINGFNNKFSDFKLETRQVPSFPSPLLSDSRVRFQLNQSDIFIHKNTADMNKFGSTYFIYNKYVSNNSSMTYKDDALHIFLMANGSYSYSSIGANYVMIGSDFIGYFANGEVWNSTNNIAHEMGHAMGLYHTNRFNTTPQGTSNSCSSTWDDYCDDTPPAGTLNPCPCWNGNADEWGHNDPNPCSYNLMAYNAKQYSLTREQIGRIHWFLTNNSTCRKYVIENYCTYNATNSISIGNSSHLVWSNTRFFDGDIVIEANSSLTIKCFLGMSSGSKIIVNKGGKLNIDGGTIGTKCGGQWQGIYVEGDKSLSQGPAGNQGSVFIQNGGIIEHARTGVTLCGLDANGNLDLSKSGGRIIANEAIFRDNFRDVSFTGYHHFPSSSSFSTANVSSFIKCEFITTNNYKSDFVSDIWPNVTMWGVVHVRFRGCTWHDQRDGSVDARMDDYLQRRVGMFTMDASYIITDLYSSQPLEGSPPNALTNSSFIDMRYGIESIDNPLSGNNYTAGRPSTVQDVQFENCLGGIYHSGVEGALLSRNEFQIKPYAVPTFRDIEAYGIYLDNCNGYQAEGNKFSSNWAVDPSNNLSVGFITTANEDRNNDIYRNTFDDNLLGAEAIGWNRHQDVGNHWTVGLKYRCNSFANISDNDLDIWATHHQTIPYTAAQTGLPQQGGGLDPMGNVFGVYGSTGNRNFNYLQNPNTFVQYFHHDPVSEPRVEPVIHFGVNSHNTGVAYSNSQCPDNTATGYYVNGTSISSTNAHMSMLIVKTGELRDLVDGGNTVDLVNQLLAVTPSTAVGLVTNMTDYSPYLSDEVLLLLSTSYSVITHSQIRDLLLLNPHSARNPNIINALQNRTDNFPTAYIDSVIGVSNIYTARDYLMDEVYHHSNAYDAGVNSILIKALNDSVDRFEEIVEPLLLASNRPQHKYRLASLYDSRGNASDANSTLVSIPVMPDFDPSRLDFHNDLLALRATLSSWNQANVDITNLDAAQIALLQTYEQKSNGIQYKVKPLLKLNEASSYIAPIYAPDMTPSSALRTSKNENTSSISAERSNDRIRQTESIVSGEHKVLGLKLYPNPVQKQLNVAYEIEGDIHTGSITIYTLQGKQVNTVKLTEASGVELLDVSGIRNGQYICTIEANGEVLKRLKFTITR